MLRGKDLIKWADNVNAVEDELLDSVAKQVRDVVSRLLPQVRAKALDNEAMNSEVEISVKFKLKNRPTTKVSGSVPPTIISCHDY